MMMREFTMEDYQKEEDSKQNTSKILDRLKSQKEQDEDRCIRCMKPNCNGCRFYREED